MLLLLLLRPRPPWNLVSSGNRIGNQALLNCLQKKLTLLPTCKFKLIKVILYFSSSPFVEPPFYFLMYLKDQPNQFVLRLLNRTCIAYNFRSRRCSQFLSNGNWNWQIWTSMDKDFFFSFCCLHFSWSASIWVALTCISQLIPQLTQIMKNWCKPLPFPLLLIHISDRYVGTVRFFSTAKFSAYRKRMQYFVLTEHFYFLKERPWRVRNLYISFVGADLCEMHLSS